MVAARRRGGLALVFFLGVFPQLLPASTTAPAEAPLGVAAILLSSAVGLAPDWVAVVSMHTGAPTPRHGPKRWSCAAAAATLAVTSAAVQTARPRRRMVMGSRATFAKSDVIG